MHHRFKIQPSEQNHFYGDNYQMKKNNIQGKKEIARYEQNVHQLQRTHSDCQITWHLTHFE